MPDNNVYDFGTGDFSLETWVKRSSLQGSAQFILGHSGDNASDDWELFWRSGISGFSSRISATSCDSATTTPLADNNWHHVVVSMDRDGLCTWYVDGVVSGTPTNISAQSATNLTNTSPLYIGRREAGNYFDGSLDEVAIYKGVALSAAQVQKHYQLGRGAPVSSGGVKKYSKGFVGLGSGVADLGYSFSISDYAAVEGDDNNYAVASGNLDNSASSSAVPMFLFKVNNPSNSNKTAFDVTAVVKSSVAPSTKPIYLQVYNGNIDNWTTIASNTSGQLNSEVTLTASSDQWTGDLSAFYTNENPGIGTRYAECANGTANCWLYFRVYQAAPGSNVNENLSLDMFDLDFGDTETARTGLRGKTRLRGGTRLR